MNKNMQRGATLKILFLCTVIHTFLVLYYTLNVWSRGKQLVLFSGES